MTYVDADGRPVNIASGPPFFPLPSPVDSSPPPSLAEEPPPPPVAPVVEILEPVVRVVKAPRAAPGFIDTYGFTVFLKSELAVGNQIGKTVKVAAQTRDDAVAAVQSTFGNDIYTLEGPVLLVGDALGAAGLSGGGGTPAAPLNSVQFNNGGAFGGDAFMTWIHPVTPAVNATLLLVGDSNNAATLETHNTTANGVNLYTHGASGFQGPSLNFSRSRGTQSAPAPLVIGDNLAYLTFFGWNGTSYVIGAQITLQVNSGGFTGTSNGACIEFFATQSNSTAVIEVMRLCNTSGVNVSELPFGVTFGNPLGFAGGGNAGLDTGWSRLAPNSVALGNGTQGDFSGSLKLTQETLQGTGQTGAAANVQPLEVHNSNSGGIGLYAHGNAINGPCLNFQLSQGTQAAPTVIAANQYLAFVDWRAYDGTAYADFAQMVVQQQGGTPGTGNHGAAIQFNVCPAGSTTLTQYMLIGTAGNGVGFSVDVNIKQGQVLSFNTNPDAGISRLGPNQLCVGNGTQGDASGTLLTQNVNLQTHSDTAATGPTLNLGRSRNTAASPNPVQSGDFLAYLNFQGWNGASYITGSQITINATETWANGPGPYGNEMVFNCTSTGSANLQEVMRIGTSGVGGAKSLKIPPGITISFNNGPTTQAGFSWLQNNVIAVGNGTSFGDTSGIIAANGGLGVILKATTSVNGGSPVKADTANANQVVPTTTADTGAGIVIGVNSASGVTAGANAAILTSGIVAMTLGTGTAAIGQFVVVDTTTNGRVKCTSTYTAGTVIGVAMSAQGSVGGTFNVMVGLR